MPIRFTTSGESHGPGLTAIVEGLPAGLPLTQDDLDRDLARRQLGHGRGGRMKIESDRADVISGIRHGTTLGSPVTIRIQNRDYANWEERMNPWPVDGDVAEVHLPRPGHADLAGVQKYGFTDVRNVLERASARETAARVACGALAKAFLAEVGVEVLSHVLRIGSVEGPVPESLGGVFEVRAFGVVPGLGSHVSWEERLDGRLAQAVMSIQAMKGVAIGDGFELSGRVGSQAHDEIFWADDRGYFRETNRAGGLEGGM